MIQISFETDYTKWPRELLYARIMMLCQEAEREANDKQEPFFVEMCKVVDELDNRFYMVKCGQDESL